MSVVVAIKDNDRVWVGCDSQVTRGGWTKESLEGCYKIWKPSDDCNIVMGGVGVLRDINILSTATDWVDELAKHKGVDDKYIIRTVVPKIYKELEDYGRLKIRDGIKSMESAFIFAYKEKAYEIAGDGAVIEKDDMLIEGSGYIAGMGAWDRIKNEDIPAKEKVIQVIKASCNVDLYVNYPIVIMNTKDDEVEIIDK